MIEKICEIKKLLEKRKPLIHCITNPISINQCANAILSLGARPIMAEHPGEVSEITATSASLMLNTGNITDTRMESIMLSLKCAGERSIPALLDVVGIACSRLRREYVLNLLKISKPSVIKGNYSEIMALSDEKYSSSGVDSDCSLETETVSKAAKELAKKHDTVILATGKRDIITDGKRLIYVKNGTPSLTSVTGTGCMLGAIASAFMTTAEPIEASVAACVYLGVCGELSETERGNGSFMVKLMDKISKISTDEISKHISVEVKED